jgi:hypothetical protein
VHHRLSLAVELASGWSTPIFTALVLFIHVQAYSSRLLGKETLTMITAIRKSSPQLQITLLANHPSHQPQWQHHPLRIQSPPPAVPPQPRPSPLPLRRQLTHAAMLIYVDFNSSSSISSSKNNRNRGGQQLFTLTLTRQSTNTTATPLYRTPRAAAQLLT